MKTQSRSVGKPRRNVPDDTKSWGAENARGRHQAECLVAVMRANDAPGLLRHSVSRMVQSNEPEGVKVGFFFGLAAAAMRGALS